MVERWRLKEPLSTSKCSALFSWSLFKLGGGFSASYKLLLNTLINCSANITSGPLHTRGVQICLHKEKHASAYAQITAENSTLPKGVGSVYT